MRITIIGWYGTETIGDRAILTGLLRVFSLAFKDYSIRLGCINTLLSERTLMEDFTFYESIVGKKGFNLSLFDTRKKRELDDSIRWADLIIIGGGPLMGIREMYMLKYAFVKARKSKKKTAVSGCGMGPFNSTEYERLAGDIINLSDLAIFRDAKSKEYYLRLPHHNNAAIFDSIDPAVFAADLFKNTVGDCYIKDYVACNFREVTAEYSGNSRSTEFFVREIIRFFGEIGLPIVFVPMHSFYMGGDDRFYLNRIKRLSNLSELEVVNRPPSLVETMQLFRDAKYCIGMRFHSVLLQTLLNGKNYIYDYTDPNKGKIVNLLSQLNVSDLYKDRYYSLVNQSGHMLFSKDLSAINVDESLIKRYMNIYIEQFKEIML